MTRESTVAGLRRLFRLPASLGGVNRDVDDELRFHFESRIADLVAQGTAPDDARRIVEVEYGDVGASRAELAAVDRRIVRRQRRVDVFDVLRRDVVYALRGLIRTPSFTATVIITLGLGVGANAAVFTVLDRVFLQAPPGVANPGGVHRLYAHKYSRREPWFAPDGKITPLFDVHDLIDLGTALRGRGRIEGDYLARRGRLSPGGQRVLMTYVSPGYFDFLGVHPAYGRFFAPEENRLAPQQSPVVVISDAFWRHNFAADSAILGRTVRVDETTYVIVGVTPREFEGLELETIDMWAPLSEEGGWDALRLLARVDQSTDPRQLDAMLTAQYRRTHQGDEMAEGRSEVVTAPLLAARAPARALSRIPALSDRSLTLLPRLAGVGLIVLVIAVANVASLLLMRAIRRRREIAVRVALGVSRSRLVAGLITESLLLAMLAGSVALVVACLTGNALRIALSPSLRWPTTVVDGRVMMFALLIAVSAGVLAGLAPAAFALRSNVSANLKVSSAGATGTGTAIRTALLVVQSGLCMALLASAGIFLQSLRRAGEFDRGFDYDRLIQLSVSKTYSGAEGELARVAERLRSLQGVEAVGRTDVALDQIGMMSKAGPTFRDTIGQGPRGPILQFVEPEFMRAAGLRLVKGRMLNASDNFTPVAVLNEALANALWPEGDAVGHCVHVREPQSPCRPVIGVVRDFIWNVTEPSYYRVYAPMAQAWIMPPSFIPNILVVRMRSRATTADVARLRADVTAMIDRGALVQFTRSVDMLEPQLRPWRLAATLLVVLGVLGMGAAAAGIYGLVAFDVTQRSRELGVRIALGATTANILRLVVSSGLRVVLMGVGAGVVAALVTGRVMASLLFDTSPYDPLVLSLTALMLVAVAALASFLPAWRAVRISPATALAAE